MSPKMVPIKVDLMNADEMRTVLARFNRVTELLADLSYAVGQYIKCDERPRTPALWTDMCEAQSEAATFFNLADTSLGARRRAADELEVWKARCGGLRDLLDRAYAALGSDEVADVFHATESETDYEEFMTECYAALCEAKRASDVE